MIVVKVILAAILIAAGFGLALAGVIAWGDFCAGLILPRFDRGPVGIAAFGVTFLSPLIILLAIAWSVGEETEEEVDNDP